MATASKSKTTGKRKRVVLSIDDKIEILLARLNRLVACIYIGGRGHFRMRANVRG